MAFTDRLHNRGSISTGYDIDNSLKFEDDNDERMQRSVSSGGSSPNVQTHTFSLWLKRTELGYRRTWGTGVSGTNEYFFYFGNNDELNFYSYASGYQLRFISNAQFRDTSAWYHFVVAIDTTQSTEANRVKIYVNGVRITDWSTSTYPSQNANLQISDKIYIGTQRNENPDFSGYISEFVYLDGTQAAITDFGEFDTNTGIWKPIDVSGLSFGTNGCYLKFDNASDLGEDANGGTSFTLSNITSADQATDTPTNNFCTMNVLDRTNGNCKNQEGATKITTDGGSGWCSMVATMGITKGKWYWETQRSGGSTDSNDVVIGIVGDSDPFIPYSSAAQYYIGNVAESSSIGFYTTGSPNVRNGSGDSVSNTAGDIIMVGLDMDNGKLYFGVNGTWDGLGTGGSTLWSSFDGGFVLPAVSVYQGKQIKINFGGYASYTISSGNTDANDYGNFEYAPPSGYYALCSKNLAEFG